MKNSGYRQKRPFQSPLGQRGAVLLMSLVILLVMTLLGVSSMQSTTLEMQMATNNQERQQAFQAAEAALAIVENNIQENGVEVDLLQGCTSGESSCYDNTCAGGLCFSGTYNAGDDQFDCEAISLVAGSPPEKVWRNASLNVWNTAAKHKTMRVSGVDNDIKYIIEFLCYTEKGDGSVFDASNPNNGAPLFRVTTLAVSNGGKARVMLQSTYRYGS